VHANDVDRNAAPRTERRAMHRPGIRYGIQAVMDVQRAKPETRFRSEIGERIEENRRIDAAG
jgi:hypothetical protein